MNPHEGWRGLARQTIPDVDELLEQTSITEVQVSPHGAISEFISAQHLGVVFQPIVNMADASLFGYEALLRSTDPRYPDPAALLHKAIECRRTGALGRAVRQLAFRNAPQHPLFINVHPDELLETWLLRHDDPIFGHGAEVFLEITETVPLTDIGRDHALFRTIRSNPNVHLVVDDLGAGFSNLKHIADLEPKLVKLDRNLVTGLAGNSRQQRLIHGIVRMCEDLGARVVAEGIETVDEYLAARDAGAHFGQGYLLARPAAPVPSIFWKP